MFTFYYLAFTDFDWGSDLSKKENYKEKLEFTILIWGSEYWRHRVWVMISEEESPNWTMMDIHNSEEYNCFKQLKFRDFPYNGIS